MVVNSMNNSITQLSAYVDDVCLHFEDSLKKASFANERPELEGFLRDTEEPLRSQLLHELVRLEVDAPCGCGCLDEPVAI